MRPPLPPSRLRQSLVAVLMVLVLLPVETRQAEAFPEKTLQSVVSVLPLWPGKPQGGAGTPAGKAPEGSGVVVGPDGLIATAYHVVEPATRMPEPRIDVRLFDGRILPARLRAFDTASDVALLEVKADLPIFDLAPAPSLAEPVCIVSNAYGLDLSVTCGVVSARHVANAGFNPVEDFIQTDAAANPGSSGGALVDADGRLVGMMSAIFASAGDTNIGVNFAVSADLLKRVVEDLDDDGRVDYVSAGWGLELPSRSELAIRAGVKITSLSDGPAAKAGLQVGDLLVAVAGRAVRHPRDVVSTLSLVRPGDTAEVVYVRAGQEARASLSFGDTSDASRKAANSATGTPDCPYAEAVCRTRQAVFPVESFDPLASAVRIGKQLLVTSRHVIADRTEATVFTPNGPLKGTVEPSAYRGDLALIEVEGLPEDGLVLNPDEDGDVNAALYAVGADIGQRQIRVFQPGMLLLPPEPAADLGRLQVTSFMQPGVSGGALVDPNGRLAGIAAGGGEGRFEALPVRDVRDLLQGRSAANAEAVQAELGRALADCELALDTIASAEAGQAAVRLIEKLQGACMSAENEGLYLEAGRTLAMAGAFDRAIVLHQAAVDQVPHSLNARLSLLVSLQLAGRFEAMLPHAEFILTALPDDQQALRLAIQAGVRGGKPELAERAYTLMEKADPRQAAAARQFIDNPPPAPERR
ncbi:trypsin-like peptidase domain-containing protein [Roseibium sp.]|uniref:trypsin-like peptidase domain-containing protein n=1 Tax=Roseibium sp. TaxID=1936156 RepID=UPI003A9844DF